MYTQLLSTAIPQTLNLILIRGRIDYMRTNLFNEIVIHFNTVQDIVLNKTEYIVKKKKKNRFMWIQSV